MMGLPPPPPSPHGAGMGAPPPVGAGGGVCPTCGRPMGPPGMGPWQGAHPGMGGRGGGLDPTGQREQMLMQRLALSNQMGGPGAPQISPGQMAPMPGPPQPPPPMMQPPRGGPVNVNGMALGNPIMLGGPGGPR